MTAEVVARRLEKLTEIRRLAIDFDQFVEMFDEVHPELGCLDVQWV